MQIMLAVMLASMVYVMIIISRNSAERINEILDEKPDLSSKENAIKEIKDSSVTFENVAFHYGKGPDVLEGVNLQIKPGESVGIVGSTGSSKTTLMSLIARLYDVSGWLVKVGGSMSAITISSLSAKAWRWFSKRTPSSLARSLRICAGAKRMRRKTR
jgi:ATP-binding cassette subfamily B protein